MPAESQTVAETLAANVRAFRQLRGMDQANLARRMHLLGYEWRQVTVSEVERGRRNVMVPELVALTVVLGVTIEQLLDSRGPERKTGPQVALTRSTGGDIDEDAMFSDPEPEPEEVMISPAQMTGLICSHKVYFRTLWHLNGDLEQIEFLIGRPDLTDLGPEGPLQ